jgi:chromosome segregation ATPase
VSYYGSTDHSHYGYADASHSHRGDYADERHDHDLDYAEKRHRHYDDESTVRGLREDLGAAEERIRELENDLRGALERIRALEGQTPQARQLQLEADQAAADLAESGYDPGEDW